MKDLIKRLEKLDAPCRECDAEIAIAVGFEPAGLFPHTIKGAMRHYADDMDGFVDDMNSGHSALSAIPRYTASIDAALTLIPDGWDTGQMDAMRTGRFRWCLMSDNHEAQGSHQNHAIAICIAALKAQTNSNEGE